VPYTVHVSRAVIVAALPGDFLLWDQLVLGIGLVAM
jgi:hypothetical protein